MQHWNVPIMYVVEMEITKNLNHHVKLREKRQHQTCACLFISPSTGEMKWNVIHPLNNSSIHYPAFPYVDIDETNYLRPSHFELLYYQNYHYDAVVAMDTGCVSTDVPHFDWNKKN